MTDAERVMTQEELSARWAVQRHSRPSACGSHYCRDGRLVQMTARGSGPEYQEIDCPMCIHLRDRQLEVLVGHRRPVKEA